MEAADLLGLVLELVAEGREDDEIVGSLVRAAAGSPTTLMGACSYALSLARDMPYDTANHRTLGLLTEAIHQAAHTSGEDSSDERDTLLRHIVEYSGGWSMAPPAVASRAAEVDADLASLRPPDDGGSATAS